MTNYFKREFNLRYKDVADIIGVYEPSLKRKLDGFHDFKLSEVIAIANNVASRYAITEEVAIIRVINIIRVERKMRIKKHERNKESNI